MTVLLEACVEGVEGAVAAAAAGVHRIELCAGLLEGGTTPSLGTVEEVIACLSEQHLTRCKVHVLVRPRPGSFCYSAAEARAALRDVRAMRHAGAHGVAVGALREDGSIDTHALASIVALAKDDMQGAAGECPPPMAVTFHRAFDACSTPALQALAQLAERGVDGVLTSGRAATAWEGRHVIRDMVRSGVAGTTVIAAAGVSASNVARLMQATGAEAVHVGSAILEALEEAAPLGMGVQRRVSRDKCGEILQLFSA
ncbi:copper homeostasis protein CutC [Tribonema minus]|uniref:Copper homeostasis protein cutC homolog n=1 Tax=Tribonema minus TaxID=303371 RepID=A0A835YMB7_9STRA|nr:copper homeostasis protein CutC [Tribonema minus]